MDCWKEDRIGTALAGTNPSVVRELDLSFAVMGDTQFLPGYMLALVKRPGIERLSDLPRADRFAFLGDVDVIASAVENVCSRRDPDFRRVNIEILGNTDPILHAHIFPRFNWEQEDRALMPVWLYPHDRWSDAQFLIGEEHESLRAQLGAELDVLRRRLR